MKLGTFRKTPVERKRYLLDYTDWLDTTETVLTKTFTVSPSTGVDPMQAEGDAIVVGGKQVSFFASHGDSGTTYTVDVVITTSAGQTKEDQLSFIVKDM